MGVWGLPFLERVTEWREGGKFPARKDCGDDAKGSFATFIHFLFHRGSPQEFAAKEGNYSLLLLLPLVPEQLDGSRPIPGVVIGWRMRTP
jgi:hypothetical protein